MCKSYTYSYACGCIAPAPSITSFLLLIAAASSRSHNRSHPTSASPLIALVEDAQVATVGEVTMDLPTSLKKSKASSIVLDQNPTMEFINAIDRLTQVDSTGCNNYPYDMLLSPRATVCYGERFG